MAIFLVYSELCPYIFKLSRKADLNHQSSISSTSTVHHRVCGGELHRRNKETYARISAKKPVPIGLQANISPNLSKGWQEE